MSQSAKTPLPKIGLFNRQRSIALNLDKIEAISRQSLPLCLAHRGLTAPCLADLPEVEVSLVSDRVIAQVHRQFMNVPGATDVITFAHGEIVVSVTTAARQAQSLGEIVEREVARYIVHGLLHLNGHEDKQANAAALMWQAQEAILEKIWPVEPRITAAP